MGHMRLAPPFSRPLFVALAVAFACRGEAQTWQGPNPGEWNVPGNWSTGVVPNFASANVTINNTTATPGLNRTVNLQGSPFTVSRINVSNNNPANSVVLGDAATDTDVLTLIGGGAPPSLRVNSGTLRILARLEGTSGFTKEGNGTLSFRDNPHPQGFSGYVGLAGGTLSIGSDQDLGAASNDLHLFESSTLLADPLDPAIPVDLNAGRGLGAWNSTKILSLANASDIGRLNIAGPITDLLSIDLLARGTIEFSGANSSTGTLSLRLLPGTAVSGLTRAATLRFTGASALPAAGKSLSLKVGSATVTNSSITSTIDLGGYSRTFSSLTLDGFNLPVASSNSSLLVDFTNGDLVCNGGSSLDISARGVNMHTEMRLPPSSTFTGNMRLGIGNYGAGLATVENTARFRIGSNATFNITVLDVGANGCSGKFDALAPGSTLKLRGNTTLNRLSSLAIGNFTSSGSARGEAIMDISDGTLDAQIGDLYLGNGVPAYPTTAALKFSNGTLDVTRLELGSGASGSANLDYSVQQAGGVALVSNVFFGSGNITGNASYVYRLGGGSLAVGNVTGTGPDIGTLQRGILWTGGTLRNYPGRSASLTTANPLAPLDIVLSEQAAKTLEVEAGRTFALGAGVRLTAPDATVALVKTGPGALVFDGDTSAFTGTLHHTAGALAFGSANAPFTVNAGAFLWDAGTLATDLSSVDTASDLLVLSGALVRGSGSAASRVIDLKSGPGDGTYTLATYASTDLTLADFTATGIAPGYTADFAVGPTALTVTVAPATPFSDWRASKFASATNLGDADDDADPDADGLPNLLEYALGTEPLAADSGPPITVAADTAAERLALTFTRIADPALVYAVLAADDPSGPWSGDGSEIVFTSTGADNVAGPVTISDSAPLSAHPRRFLRLVVSR
jgi:autotransporter-associated beta strand protein